MNISDFSLLKEADDHYIIGHPKGRSLNVSKQGLSHKAHQIIENLKRRQHFNEGTEDGTEEEKKSTKDDEEESDRQPASEGEDQTQSQLGGIEKSLEGLKPQEEYGPAFEDPLFQVQKQLGEVSKAPGASAKGVNAYENLQSGASKLAQKEAPPEGEEEPAPEGTTAEPQFGEQTQVEPLPPQMAGQAAPTAAAVPAQAPAAAPSSAPLTPEQMVREGLETQKQAGLEQKRLLEEAAEKQAQGPTAEDIFKKNQESHLAFAQAILNGKIDPDRYVRNMDTGSRIASGIAMIISGIGSGLTGQPNYAIQHLEKAIDRDIDAQKSDKGDVMNLWKMNMDIYKNEQAATLAAKNQMLVGSMLKLKAAAALLPSAQAQIKAAPALAKLQEQITDNDWKIAVTTGAPGSEEEWNQKMGQMQIKDRHIYEDLQKRTIPGVGRAKRQLSEKQLHDIGGFQSLNHGLLDALHFAKTKRTALGTRAGSLVPLTDNELHKEGTVIRNNILFQLNHLYGLSRLNETEYKAFKEQIPHPGSFFDREAVRQLETVMQQVQDKTNSTYKLLGVDKFAQSPRIKQAVEWGKQNMGSPDPVTSQKALGILKKYGGM